MLEKPEGVENTSIKGSTNRVKFQAFRPVRCSGTRAPISVIFILFASGLLACTDKPSSENGWTANTGFGGSGGFPDGSGLQSGSGGTPGFAGTTGAAGTAGFASTTGFAGTGDGGAGGEILIMDGGADDGGAGVAGSTGGAGGTGAAGSGGTSGAGSGGTSGAGSGGTSGAGSGGTSGAGGCDKPSPPAEMQNTIDLTWTEMTGGMEGKLNARPVSAGIQNFTNTILDQIASTGGSINYCIRWDATTATASQTLRDKIAAALERQVNNWFSKLVGYDCWPHGHIPVRVTGWATRDRNLLLWQDDAVRIDVGDIRENAPQCMEACGRFFNREPGYTYPNCPGGFDGHYDLSLWLTQGMGMGGAGGDWGERLDTDYFIGAVDADNIHIFLHEFGHGFGFPDYYDWDVWAPGVPRPNSVMVAGTTFVTEWDGWMLRHTYSQIKSRL